MGPPAEASSEPSIEEILDSIRQIISDDDTDQDAPAAAPAAAPASAAKPARADDDIIELTEKVEEPKKAAAPPPPPPEPAKEPAKPPIEVDMTEPEPEAAPPAPPPARAPAPEPPPAMTQPEPIDNLESVITKHAEAAAMKAFTELTQKASIEKGGSVTIEDVVRYEVRPLLRAWIDKYLPGIVERLLQKELERISRRFEQD